MHKTLIECDPVTDRRIWGAVQRERTRLRRRNQQAGTTVTWDRLTVDALVEAVSSPSRSGRGSLVVHILIPVVLDGSGVVLDQGRSRRLATADQRTAIEAMQSTCSHPDCTVTIDDCRIHHVRPWERGGRTDLADLAPVCEVHHHQVHEGGWTLTMTADRTATWTRPDGEIYWSGSLLDRTIAPAG
jgi:hypothetical protein